MLTVGLTLAAAAVVRGQLPADTASGHLPVPAALTSAPRPRLPADAPQIWLVPDAAAASPVPASAAAFASAMRVFNAGRHAEALALFKSAALSNTPLAAYAGFYGGLCHLNLSRPADARSAFAGVRALRPPGFLSEAAIGREAEAAAATGDHAAAARLYDEMARLKTASPDAVLLSLGIARRMAGDRAGAAQAFSRLYYELPLSDLAATAFAELASLDQFMPARRSAARTALELGRAERLFNARRYQPARQAFAALEPMVGGDDAEQVSLRLAECDYYLRRYRQARERLAPLLKSPARREEAGFFSLSAARGLGAHDEYVRLARALIAQSPASQWAEETLNGLATHYLVLNDYDRADEVFRELLAKFPNGSYAERAAWRAGWRAYRQGRLHETTAFFESAVAAFPRSDYRPAYLYWSARAREKAGDRQGAASVYRIATADYLNTYYGRLAFNRMVVIGVKAPPSPREASAPIAASPPPTAGLIRLLIALGLYEQARDELLYAQRAWGDSPAIGATLGWVHSRLGDYRRGTVLMKRAYPQYMSEEGGRLPDEALKVIFPLDYWPLIRKHAALHKLDPYLVAALVNQESAYDPRIRSSAGAIGLMQVMPATGRQWAHRLGLKRYSTALLTSPETNIQIGTAHFAEMLRRTGDIPRALAAYNAGELRVVRWDAERPGLETDEYIDDIPFPETQMYVKKIVGTVEDYRRLYPEAPAGARPSGSRTPARPGR